MKKYFFLISIIFFFNFSSSSQSVVYWENFETTGYNWRATFSNSNAVYVSGISSTNDNPQNTAFYNSFNTSIVLFGSGNSGSGPERTILNLPVVTLNPNIAYCIKLKMASFGINMANYSNSAGIDNQDYLRLNVAYNGSNTYSPEIQVNGSNNIMWSYNAPSTIYRTVQGSLSNYAQVVGQEFSTIILELPIGTTQISAEIDLSCNSSGESWFVDDVQIISGCYSPLPIELLYFNGSLKENKVELKWATATEINNDYFSIYSCEDFQNIGLIGIVKGSGNSNFIREYSFLDNNPKKYYRICQTDYDGKFECFDWISIKNSEYKNLTFKIYDIYGRETDLDHNGLIILVDYKGNARKILLKK